MENILKIIVLFILCSFNFSVAQEQKIEKFVIDKNQKDIIVNDIVQDDIGYLWIATNLGLYQYDGLSFTQKTTSNCKTVFTKKDTLFVGTKNKLLVIVDERVNSFESKAIQKISEINNTIYLATSKGISIFKNNSVETLQFKNKIDSSTINDILKIDHTIYIASNSGLWSLKNLKEGKKIADGNFKKLIENRKHIITTTRNGTIEVIMKDKNIKTIITETKISNIYKVKDEIWLTSNGFGIDIYDANNYSFQKKINKYNTNISDKLTSIYVDKYHSIWLGSYKDGLFKISSKNNTIEEKPILKLNTISTNFNQIDVESEKKLLLNAKENNISFSYKTVSLVKANAISYRYKLNGSYSQWLKTNTVEFTNLKSGNYHFYVQSKIGDRLSNEIYIPFVIDNPFYKKDWFYILSATALFGLLFLFMEFRFQKNKKEDKKKIKELELQNHLISLEQKALQLQMNPHFIFNVLNGIKAFGNKGEISTMNETISQFSILLRSILQNSRLEEINLTEELKTIENYLALEQKISSKKFTYSLKTVLNNIAIEEILIPPMLVQPFIENSIKHGFQPNKESNTIEVLFEVKQRFLHCSIKDNGIGFYQSKKEKSNNHSLAIQITKERVINLSSKHSFMIEEIKENDTVYGTKVWFKIPLKTDY